jgi:stress response protein YsnF
MAATVIGVFDADSIGKVTKELIKAGFADRDLDVIEGAEKEIVSTIVDRGYERDDAQGYAKAVRNGKKLLAASTPPQHLDEVVAIMERYEVGLDEAGDEVEAGEAVPVVEEELSTEQRKVARGGVRVTSTVREKPVEETVTLREEHVEAKRRPVDRVLSEDEAEDAFRNRTVEMTETAEELEVGKEARVVEEVVLEKTAREREQTVKDTVRRTDVEVERIGGAQPRKKS